MAITVKINSVDRTDYILANSFSIIDELTSRVNSASFIFICNDKTVAPTAGESVLIEEGATKLFSGRILSKEESFFPPDRLKYQIECIDNTRDLDKLLVIKTYLNQTARDIIKDIIDNYTTGFTYANVSGGPTITKIAFDYVQVSEAITKIAEATGYEWYVDYDKDLYFFLKTDYPAPFELNDNQAHYKDLVIDYDISQLRNRIYVKSEKYETLDFTELFIGDGATVTWTCKYQASAIPSPSATLDDVAKTVGWDGVDDPALFDFMLNASTKVLSLGTEGTPADGAELVITYGADQAIIVRWDDQDSIDAVKAIEGGDGIFEHCITDNNIDTKEWAIDIAKADLLKNADPVIKGIFITDSTVLRSGQIITLNSTKRNINQNFLIQKIELMRILPVIAYPSIPYKPAATATVGYKTAATATERYKSSTTGEMIYYIYRITIATKLKGLEDLILSLLYNSNESLKRDTEAPAVPTNLALSTGMGEYTQASLAWIKAEWDANTEDDFSHYELKYKKTAYSDFGLVTTTNTTFLFISLEQNIEYQVYICSVDIYGNRSAWSSVQAQTTATDTDTPAQVTGAVATALLAGIKVTWTKATENNIEGYKVERQESDDGTTWVEAWTEVVRITANLWLDLLLTYTKFYRYRISTITQTGTAGATSTPTADSIAPNKAGANDIIANCITAAQIAANTITANEIAAGTITTIEIAATTIVAGNIAAGTITGTQIAATTILAGNIATNAITADKILANAVTTAKINANAVTATKISVTSLAAVSATLGSVSAGNIQGTRLQIGSGTNEDIYFEDSGIRFYDAGGYALVFARAGLASASISMGSNWGAFSSAGSKIVLGTYTKSFIFWDGGTFQMCNIASAPTGHAGDIVYNSTQHRFQMYIGGGTNAWGYELMSAGW